MSLVVFRCARCRKQTAKESSAVNRAKKSGLRLFCDRRCAGLARRSGKTKTEKREAKRLYDIEYLAGNRERRLAQKREYHKRTYDPEKAAGVRKKRMPRHVEYCRRPEYRAKKHEYDAKRYAKQFGPFAECVGILQELNAEIASRMSKYEIYMANGRYDKYAERRRERRLTSEEFHRR